MRSLPDKRSGFVSSYFFKYISTYVSFAIIQFFIFKILLSIVAFFHLLLNHKFSIIEEWTFRNAWEILIISKSLSFYIVYLFINLKIEIVASFDKVLGYKNLKIPREVFVLILFLFCSYFILGRPIVNDTVVNNSFSFFYSFVGTIFFYGCDLLIFCFLNFLYPFKRKMEKLLMALAMAVIFSLVSGIIYDFSHYSAAPVFFNFFLLLVLVMISAPHAETAFTVILLYIAPNVSLLGQDPLWGKDFSLLIYSQEISIFQQLILYGFIMLYFWLKHRKVGFEWVRN